jgi:SAM-dependent methyltransferase
LTSAERWAEALAGWAIPADILAQAPESPWGFPPALFGGHSAPAGLLLRVATDGLEDGRTVLDVGCGGGAASIPLAGWARSLIGVDASPAMLASFARAADAVGVAHREVLGEWPKIAGRVGQADLVVCRNVVYNVADIVPFVTALSARAARRVAVELTAVHPSVAMAPVWKRFWGLDRPDGPSAALFAAVVADLGFEPVMESENRPVAKATDGGADYVAFVRRRLCLPAQRDGEIANALAATDTVVTAVAVVWDPRVGSYRKPAVNSTT